MLSIFFTLAHLEGPTLEWLLIRSRGTIFTIPNPPKVLLSDTGLGRSSMWSFLILKKRHYFVKKNSNLEQGENGYARMSSACSLSRLKSRIPIRYATAHRHGGREPACRRLAQISLSSRMLSGAFGNGGLFCFRKLGSDWLNISSVLSLMLFGYIQIEWTQKPSRIHPIHF